MQPTECILQPTECKNATYRVQIILNKTAYFREFESIFNNLFPSILFLNSKKSFLKNLIGKSKVNKNKQI